MYTIIVEGVEKRIETEGGNLREILRNHCFLPDYCGGNGRCGKCIVLCEGKKVLSCRVNVDRDMRIEIPSTDAPVQTSHGVREKKTVDGESFFAVDIGTTTVAVALCDGTGVAEIAAFDNPQIRYGADVLARIDAVRKYGIAALREPLLSALENAEKTLAEKYRTRPVKTVVTGNTTMLHIFWGENPAGIGTYPYTAKFLDFRKEKSTLSLPCIAAYVGSDIVAGLSLCDAPKTGADLLIDLGTNAEIALILPDKILTATTSAGPCFEGANISCGMPAREGAVTSFFLSEDGKKEISFLGEKPKGICGTALIDVVANLLHYDIIDKEGYLITQNGYPICENIYLSQGDVRAFQLAKSAIRSGVEILAEKANISLDEVGRVYLAGGFSSQVSVQNAERCGLLAKGFSEKSVVLENASLQGAVSFGQGKTQPEDVIRKATAVNLDDEKNFHATFIKNLSF